MLCKVTRCPYIQGLQLTKPRPRVHTRTHTHKHITKSKANPFLRWKPSVWVVRPPPKKWPQQNSNGKTRGFWKHNQCMESTCSVCPCACVLYRSQHHQIPISFWGKGSKTNALRKKPTSITCSPSRAKTKRRKLENHNASTTQLCLLWLQSFWK